MTFWECSANVLIGGWQVDCRVYSTLKHLLSWFGSAVLWLVSAKLQFINSRYELKASCDCTKIFILCVGLAHIRIFVPVWCDRITKWSPPTRRLTFSESWPRQLLRVEVSRPFLQSSRVKNLPSTACLFKTEFSFLLWRLKGSEIPQPYTYSSSGVSLSRIGCTVLPIIIWKQFNFNSSWTDPRLTHQGKPHLV